MDASRTMRNEQADQRDSWRALRAESILIPFSKRQEGASSSQRTEITSTSYSANPKRSRARAGHPSRPFRLWISSRSPQPTASPRFSLGRQRGRLRPASGAPPRFCSRHRRRAGRISGPGAEAGGNAVLCRGSAADCGDSGGHQPPTN